MTVKVMFGIKGMLICGYCNSKKKQKGNDSMNDSWKKYQKNQDEEDDGRTVADMSDVQRSTFLGGWRPIGGNAVPEKQERSDDDQSSKRRPWEDDSLTKEERRMYVFGAMKAALLIGMVYLVGGGLLIALLLALWR